jgi:hypothetical protein
MNKTIKSLFPALAALFFSISLVAKVHAQSYVTVEGAGAWQSRNDQRIPGDTGTQFSISDFKTGPFIGYRVYAGHIWNNTHELRALYAPLAFEVDGIFGKPVNFQDTTFAADTKTSAYYKFNSYRLTYAYHFESAGPWHFALGFTGKIRDAEVRLTQQSLRESKKNVGFVPLLNVQIRRELGQDWQIRFDVDGLAAPQGRAFDAGLFIDYLFDSARIFTGYRTVEGGADNDKVYNFAWIHFATLGANFSF